MKAYIYLLFFLLNSYASGFLTHAYFNKNNIVKFNKPRIIQHQTLKLVPKMIDYNINPIKKIYYDDIINNINYINHVFISSNNDRIVILFYNDKGVYYFNNNKECDTITNILKFNNIHLKVIKDYIREMDSYDGVLYCEPLNKTHIVKDLPLEKYKLDNILKNSYQSDIDKIYNKVYNTTKPKLLDPIPLINYDEIIYNIKNISYVFLSGNYDRVVIFFNNTKGVYYFENKEELDRLEYIFNLNKIKIKIIYNYKAIMDTYNGLLFCYPNYSDIINDYNNFNYDDVDSISFEDIYNDYE